MASRLVPDCDVWVGRVGSGRLAGRSGGELVRPGTRCLLAAASATALWAEANCLFMASQPVKTLVRTRNDLSEIGHAMALGSERLTIIACPQLDPAYRLPVHRAWDARGTSG